MPIIDQVSELERTQERRDSSRFSQYGLALPKATLKALQCRGIYCQSGISLEHQHLANKYVLRATESGGAVRDMGRYCAYLDSQGRPLPLLQPIDSIGINGRHAVLIAQELVRIEMLRIGRTYELALSRHGLSVEIDLQRPTITSTLLFRGKLGTLALDLWNEEERAIRGRVIPIFYTRAGEVRRIPTVFDQAVQTITGAVSCVGCKHIHFAVPPEI
jgi:hypothetical protein